ncbi:hypothetical protein STAFG_4822 [Streptomyces afghaniensis 772]|uniref:Uncharacterized protein n=1 Tax=Streptomyces afghaniensis 772 TaxID=1283301 RepID=S4MWG2_9ACTN|nr:hypothetical protein STAFG_4822 [Streptomyces afghaniensis 772]
MEGVSRVEAAIRRHPGAVHQDRSGSFTYGKLV